MKLKITVASLVTASALLFSAHAITPFTDISDPTTAQSAQLLQLLGIVNGTSEGVYTPDRGLTRAEFCKVAVHLMGNHDQVASHMNRTIFKDVTSTHWARGYINIATQGISTGDNISSGIIRGDAYGNFSPDRTITYAEAVTILMRILGHTDTSVGFGVQWYDGYLNTAQSIGLTTGISTQPNDDLNRGVSALLLDNFLHTPMVGATENYMTSHLNCSTVEDVLVFSADDSTITLQDNATYSSALPLAPSLVGTRVNLLLDSDGNLLSHTPSTKGSWNRVHIASTTYNSIKTSKGDTLSISPTTLVWQNGEATTFQAVYQDLLSGIQATAHYSQTNQLEYLYLHDTPETDLNTSVLSSSNYSTSYTVYKNGLLASSSDLHQYDVITLDSTSQTLRASDLKISGVYENAYPSPATPATITLMGQEFDVLSSGATDLQNFAIGDTVTLLLSHDGKVAGALSTNTVTNNLVGIVDDIDSSGMATVTPLGMDFQFTGKTTASTNMIGQLVTVSSSSQGYLTLSTVTGNSAKANLNLTANTLGSTTLADNVIFLERVGYSRPIQISREQITLSTVSQDNVVYYRTNYAGKADVILLDSVTGDCYDYGFLQFNTGETYTVYEDGKEIEIKSTPDTITIKNALQPDGSSGCYTVSKPKSGTPSGLVSSLSTNQNGVPKVESYLELTKISGISSSDFSMATATLNTTDGMFPISQSVQCYNQVTNTWFTISDGDAMTALNSARAFASSMDVYYDNLPENGGKIRLVVVTA